MYKAKNGFTLYDSMTPAGFEIQAPNDIMTALLYYPAFETVATGILWEAIEQAITERQEYKDIDEFARYLAENYI